MENSVYDWKQWLEEHERNEIIPFQRQNFLPTFQVTDNAITEEEYNLIINNITQPYERLHTYTSHSIGQNELPSTGF